MRRKGPAGVVIYADEPPVWLRGPAVVRDDVIELDRDRAEEYPIQEWSGLALDLAAVTTPKDAVTFVARHGLLWHGPHAREWREPLWRWRMVAHELRSVAGLHRAVRGAFAGDADGLAYLRAQWDAGLRHHFEHEATTDEELIRQGGVMVAELLNQGLRDVTLEVASGPDPDVFRFLPWAEDLERTAWYDFARRIVARVDLSACWTCGRLFEVKDQRQTYCSSTCSARERQRRMKQRRREQVAAGV